MQSRTAQTVPAKRKRCGAKKRDGSPCRTWGMENGRCRMHGGASKRGVESGTFKHGRYSKYLPEGMGQLYEEAAADPDLLSIREDIALTAAMITETMQAWRESGVPLWKLMRHALKGLREALGEEEPDPKEVKQAWAFVDRVLAESETAEAAEGRIIALQQHRRSLMRTETQRLQALQQYITAERAMALAQAILGAAQRTVRNREDLQAFVDEVRALMEREGTAG